MFTDCNKYVIAGILNMFNTYQYIKSDKWCKLLPNK